MSEVNPKTVLFQAIQFNQLDDLKKLLELKSEDVANIRDEAQNGPLHLAIQGDSLSTFNLLLTCNHMDLEQQNMDGERPLQLALLSRCNHFARKLVERGADLNTPFANSKTPLYVAVSKDKAQIVRLLLAHGANVNQPSGNKTPLHKACNKELLHIVELLVVNGANIAADPNCGVTPLYIALKKQNIPMQEILLKSPSYPKTNLDYYTFYRAASSRTPCFRAMVEHLTHVDFLMDADAPPLSLLFPAELKLTANRFPEIVRDCLTRTDAVKVLFTKFSKYQKRDVFFRSEPDLTPSDMFENICFMLDGDFVPADFFRKINKEKSLVKCLCQGAMAAKFPMNTLKKACKRLLSKGIGVHLTDLVFALDRVESWELFRVLLEADEMYLNLCCNLRWSKYAIPYLMYEVSVSLEEFLEDELCQKFILYDLIAYSALPQLKKFLILEVSLCDPLQIARVERMPSVPSLLELSRNACRKAISDHYGARRFKDLLNVVNLLPIDRCSREIITMERTIYR